MQSPFVLVIFGATGDLAHKKLIPALFAMYKQNQLPQDFFIVGFARRDLQQEEFAKSFETFQDDAKWHTFIKHLYYQQGSFGEEEGYQQLVKKLAHFDGQIGACITRVFYLATPPEHYEHILNFLKDTKLSEGCGQGSSKWTRIAIEKPFGKDLETAKMLDNKLAQIFEERQIFRVDHYLGKETVQNMIVFRFANSIFEPIWNNEFIDHVQITLTEKSGIEKRGKFFDGVGILRDVGQNHILQLLASVAMDMPKSFSKEGVRDARCSAISALQCIDPKQVGDMVVRGQYEGYLSEQDVNSNSQTETFVAFKAFVQNGRFDNVPFYVRAGKKMEKNEVTISVVFKQTCHLLFKEIGCPEEGNILTFRIQPDEGISIQFIAKTPGEMGLGTTQMNFSYAQQFGTSGQDAYQKVLLDIFTGDQMLFNRSDELESSWQFITNILNGWEQNEGKLFEYKQGTWGPQKAQELIEKDGRKWI
ncbi:MAG TPA: glucose-6-phosphate dehydrogenase [Patescibacteria group bacterium]